MTVSNINNLRFLYCRAPEKVENIEELNEQLITQKLGYYYHTLFEQISDVFITSRFTQSGLVQAPPSILQRGVEIVLGMVAIAIPFGGILHVLGAHIPDLTEPISHLFEKGGHFGLIVGHHHHEHHHYRANLNMRGDNATRFLALLAVELTTRFYHEIIMLSEGDCDLLIGKHAEQIKIVLQKFKDDTSEIKLSQNQIRDLILGAIDPEPDAEIDKRINSYVINRQNRWPFRSNSQEREEYLGKINAKKNQENNSLIQELSQNVLFKDDWWQDKKPATPLNENPAFGIENPMLRALTLYGFTPLKNLNTSEKPSEFNNFTYLIPHDTLKDTVKDLLILCMRKRVITLKNNQKNNILNSVLCVIDKLYSDHDEKIRQVSLKYDQLFEKMDQRMEQHERDLEQLRNQLDNLNETIKEMKENEQKILAELSKNVDLNEEQSREIAQLRAEVRDLTSQVEKLKSRMQEDIDLK